MPNPAIVSLISDSAILRKHHFAKVQSLDWASRSRSLLCPQPFQSDMALAGCQCLRRVPALSALAAGDESSPDDDSRSLLLPGREAAIDNCPLSCLHFTVILSLDNSKPILYYCIYTIIYG